MRKPRCYNRRWLVQYRTEEFEYFKCPECEALLVVRGVPPVEVLNADGTRTLDYPRWHTVGAVMSVEHPSGEPPL